MDERRSGVPLVLICLLAACSGVEDDRSSSQAPVADTSVAWGCDDPQPGHPTAAEKRAFIEEVGTLAITAEERHGVPATAITAMAILESGYGWTRLAENTNNLLGWKYSPGASGEERDFWVLECPEKGTSDRFLVFRDRADAVDYVAGQLASSDNYRADTERYRRDRTSGVHVVEAVNRWVDGIADPYSSQPEAYRTRVQSIMNDTYEFPDGSERNLYSLSDSVGRSAQSAQALAR
jgi:Mannosyl-glycoprotein endo-beta-N-acetylglucosaminidase